jgi:hypothetical protein
MDYDDYWSNMYSGKVDRWRDEEEYWERKKFKYDEIRKENINEQECNKSCSKEKA